MNRVYHKSIIIFSVICNTVFPGVFRLLHRLSLVNSLILWSLKQILTLYPKTGCDFCRDQCLLGAGYAWDTIEALLFCSSRTVDRWLQRFQAEGVAGLTGRKRGRP